MFEVFRDIRDYANGIDLEQARKQRVEKWEDKKEKQYIFSKKARAICMAVGLLFIIVSVIIIFERWTVWTVVKQAVLLAIDIFVMVCLCIRDRTAEKMAAAGIALFIALNFLLAFM